MFDYWRLVFDTAQVSAGQLQNKGEKLLKNRLV